MHLIRLTRKPLKHGINPKYSNMDMDMNMKTNKTRKASSCWSHPGSYFGLLTIQTIYGDRVLIESGSADHGFALVTLNDVNVTGGHYGVRLAGKSGQDQIFVTLVDAHHLMLTAGLYRMSIDNSDMFVNIGEVMISDWGRLVGCVRSHGLLGQTWQMVGNNKDKKKNENKDNNGDGSDVSAIEGLIDDYAESSNDIWGGSTMYNQFRV